MKPSPLKSLAVFAIAAEAVIALSSMSAAKTPKMGGDYENVIAIPVNDPTTKAIAGALFAPPGAGPFPAIVYMSDCAGLNAPEERAQAKAVIDRMTSSGVATLIIDPFTLRGETEGICDRINAKDATYYFSRGGSDSIAAINHLKTMRNIDQSKIFIQGYSYGATSSLMAIDAANLANRDADIAGVIAYYPYCSKTLAPTAPALVFIGEKDDSLAACAAVKSKVKFELVVYPGATHAFALPFTSPTQKAENDVVFDPHASRDAQVRAEAFLSEHKSANFAIERVFYATDRSRGRIPASFGNERGVLSFGYCDVSIPRDHRMGELEAPSIWRLEFKQDPEKHVVLLQTIISSKEEFFNDISTRVGEDANHSALIFVHGYNVTFADAARRTAQLAYDLSFSGAPIFYSWPSQGTLEAYTVDEQSIEWTEIDLGHFLTDFFAQSDAKNIYIIAHSMGNRALTRALQPIIASKPEIRGRLREIILAAPDIDADVFTQKIAPALTALVSPITLYSSSRDLALTASKKIHLYPRAGDSGTGLVVMPGIETIDATNVDTSLIGHSYFAENRSILSDMFDLIHNGLRPTSRFGLSIVNDKLGAHWIIKH